MTTTTATKTARTVVASASNTAGSTTRGTLSLATAHGGVLTAKITNGATGPTVQCTCNVLVAHNASTPTAASAGADWKTVFSFGGGSTNSAVTEQHYVVPPGVMQLEVEFTGNTAQTVTVEAYLSELTSYSTA
jgi:hypothetical protein